MLSDTRSKTRSYTLIGGGQPFSCLLNRLRDFSDLSESEDTGHLSDIGSFLPFMEEPGARSGRT